MNLIKRIIYLGYYLKTQDWHQFRRFFNHVKVNYNISKFSLWKDIISNSLKHNISLLEYFQFRFFEKDNHEKKTFAGTGFMYEYQLKMNPKDSRKILSDKLKFLPAYKDFVQHKYISLQDLKQNPDSGQSLLSNKSGKVVLKHSTGQCGRGIEVKNATDFNPTSLIQRLEETENDFVEEFVEQHDQLMRMSPSGLNTIRVITQINEKGVVDILGARLRITVNSAVDNLAAGNIAAPINVDTGIIEGPAVYSDITKKDVYKHPFTGVEIIGFAIPFWKETIELTKNAALVNPDNRSIGWDVAITNQGPELIEGNHDWCKLLWQLPIKKGLKPTLQKYLSPS